MKYAAVVLDLDGTLLNSQKKISERNRKAIIDCYSKGMKIIYATARPPRTVKYLLPDELYQLGSFIYYNGAYVDCKFTETTLHFPIPENISKEFLEYCSFGKPDCNLGVEVKDHWFSNKEVDYSAVTNVKESPIVKTIQELKQFEVTKFLVADIPDFNAILERYSSKLNLIITDNGKLLQVMSKEASKEQAVRMLCDKYEISVEEIICFGDDHNDLGVFKVSGYSVAMGNAINELKEISHEVTGTNDEDGVGQVLERLVGVTQSYFG
ncbi:HAD family phosphatase [Paenibacillus sp. IB182496]|uniref:HAD family phosphatase n=1 Tax=Paenibacillus sabuli TaxID=2772509 RepID=A0A927C0K7_9BACL|nr:Cof-type HAD-IIB family hydrolase [Paenibacillus sabuli]MBD2848693.1 HAD family phosphatase [Paenibacillus sabuli]